MRRLVIITCLIGVAVGGCHKKAGPPTPKPVAPAAAAGPSAMFRLHFVGAAQLAGNTNANKLRELWAVTNTPLIWDQAATRLSKAASNLFVTTTNFQPSEAAVLLRPMWEDLRERESLFQITAFPDRNQARRFDNVTTAEWTLAVRLPEERAEYWRTNLTRLMTGFHQYWEWTRPKQAVPLVLMPEKNLNFRVVREGEWLVAGLGAFSKLEKLEEVVAAIKNTGMPGPVSTNWLEVTADFPALGALFPWCADLKLPKAELAVIGRGENLRTFAALDFAEPHPWQMSPWQIPTNLIREPLNSFTASRGLLSELKRYDWFKRLQLNPDPDQVFFWAQLEPADPPPLQPLRTTALMPVKNGTETLEKLFNQWVRLTTNVSGRGLGQFLWQTNHTEFGWGGFPMLPLLVRLATNSGMGEVLIATGSPVPEVNTNLAPPELIQEVTSRTNLLYYDWEITQDRLRQMRYFAQVRPILTDTLEEVTRSTTQLWLNDLAGHLGNSITMITAVSSTRLELRRSAHLGLTGFEIAALARWFDNPAFPGYESLEETAKRVNSAPVPAALPVPLPGLKPPGL